MNEQTVTAIELRRALLDSLEHVAPHGGQRSVASNEFCDVLVGVLADTLAATQPATAQEIERLSALFRETLSDAMAERRGVCGHA